MQKKSFLRLALLLSLALGSSCVEENVEFTADLKRPSGSNLPSQFQIYNSTLTPTSAFYEPFTVSINIEDSYSLADFEMYVFSEGFIPCPTVELLSSFDIQQALKVPEEGDPDPSLFFVFDGVYHIRVNLTMRYYYYRYLGPGNN